MPIKKSSQDACYDMFARTVTRLSDLLCKVELGVAIQPQFGHRIAIYPRSSISYTGWVLANCVGVGDENYRGEYTAIFASLRQGASFPYKVGDRVCQMEILPYNEITFTVVEELPTSDRGEEGFGSTGNN